MLETTRPPTIQGSTPRSRSSTACSPTSPSQPPQLATARSPTFTASGRVGGGIGPLTRFRFESTITRSGSPGPWPLQRRSSIDECRPSVGPRRALGFTRLRGTGRCCCYPDLRIIRIRAATRNELGLDEYLQARSPVRLSFAWQAVASAIGDLRQRLPHRRAARDRHREACVLLAQALQQLHHVVGGVDPHPHRPCPSGSRQIAREAIRAHSPPTAAPGCLRPAPRSTLARARPRTRCAARSSSPRSDSASRPACGTVTVITQGVSVANDRKGRGRIEVRADDPSLTALGGWR